MFGKNKGKYSEKTQLRPQHCIDLKCWFLAVINCVPLWWRCISMWSFCVFWWSFDSMFNKESRPVLRTLIQSSIHRSNKPWVVVQGSCLRKIFLFFFFFTSSLISPFTKKDAPLANICLPTEWPKKEQIFSPHRSTEQHTNASLRAEAEASKKGFTGSRGQVEKWRFSCN